MRFTTLLIIFVGGALLLALGGTFFTVHQTRQAIVLQFGEVKREIRQPGLHFKIPIVQNVIYYENRTLALDPPPFEVLLTDKKRINIDAYVRYRIVSPSAFYQRITTEARLRDRFGKSVNAALQRVIATVSLEDLLSPERDRIMAQIEEEATQQSVTFGVEVIDVRIGRTDLPPQTSEAVFNRMRTEREREARELRAEGAEMAQKIRAEADKERIIILAESERISRILRGEGEANRNEILGEAFSQDPDFFEFYKSLEQYQSSLLENETTMILSPDSQFFRFFKTPQ